MKPLSPSHIAFLHSDNYQGPEPLSAYVLATFFLLGICALIVAGLAVL